MLEDTTRYDVRRAIRWAIYTGIAALPLAAIPVVMMMRDGMARSEALPTLLFFEAMICVFPAAISMVVGFPLWFLRSTRGIGTKLVAYGATLGVIVFGSLTLESLLGTLGMGQV